MDDPLRDRLDAMEKFAKGGLIPKSMPIVVFQLCFRCGTSISGWPYERGEVVFCRPCVRKLGLKP
jgi:hypothetical protein